MAVIVMAAALSVPIYRYWEFLTEGMRPSESTMTLNELETKGVPDFEVKDMAGETLRFSQFKGKVLLVNIWATWCAPCVKEFPSMKGLVEHFKGDLVVLAISHDKSREDVESFIRAFGGLPKDFIVAMDPEKSVAKIFGTEVLPETYIFTKEQKIYRKIAGETLWNDTMAIDFFDRLVKGTAH